ncbi:Dabb family protein [Burkholderia anthina]|uniref:Dabb family protein n=1 Tax=Burkholderia anthina TaxID=179879 RepID=UPI001CF56743|nr:Dabb family protein [Burkholderia anthina]MCA8095531.1 Dabb family protein [Burkholderia anthina]
MIRHIVMWKVRGVTQQERVDARRRVKHAFETLRGRIPGLTHVEVGMDVGVADHACDLVLVSDFDSPDALAAYADHPEHLRVRAELDGLRIERHQVDYITD